MRTKPPRGLEPPEEVVDVRRLDTGLGVEGYPFHDRTDLLERLKVGPVIEPRVAGSDPANPVGFHAMSEKPNARVRGRLAGPEHDI